MRILTEVGKGCEGLYALLFDLSDSSILITR